MRVGFLRAWSFVIPSSFEISSFVIRLLAKNGTPKTLGSLMPAGRRFFLTITLFGSLLLAGCKNRDLVENELRARDIQYREALEELGRAESQNEALQREIEALRQGGKVTPEQAAQMFGLRRIVLGRMTGGYDNDGLPGDEALQVVIEPRDAADHSIKAPGRVQVTALEINFQGVKTPIGEWSIGPEQLRQSWKQGLLSTGYVITLPWQKPPQSENLRVVARLTLPDGRVYEADKDVKVRLLPGRSRPQEIMPKESEPVFVPSHKQLDPNVPVGVWYVPPLPSAIELGRPVPYVHHAAESFPEKTSHIHGSPKRMRRTPAPALRIPFMARRQKPTADFAALLRPLAAKLQPPFAIALGSPKEAADLAVALPAGQLVCWQLDLFQAARLRDELAARNLSAEVVALPDLWDLPQQVGTIVYPVQLGGERGLKLDVIEQAYHALVKHGHFVVLSPYEQDNVLPPALKKVFGRVHVPPAIDNSVFWCRREGDRPRRRHEMTFQVRANETTSLRFVSRPGVFSYGRFDHGARALVEAAEINAGDRIVDLGCGCGTNGILAAQRSGPEGFVGFVDSNIRAIALTELNARQAG